MISRRRPIRLNNVMSFARLRINDLATLIGNHPPIAAQTKAILGSEHSRQEISESRTSILLMAGIFAEIDDDTAILAVSRLRKRRIALALRMVFRIRYLIDHC